MQGSEGEKWGQLNPYFCGTGRILIPMPSRVDKAIAVDISASMLAEAQKNVEAQSLTDVKLVKSLSRLDGFSTEIDYFQSLHVFQHMPVNIGLIALKNLLKNLKPNGIGVIHIPF